MSEQGTPVETMLVIALFELVKELRASDSINADRLIARIETYVDDARMQDVQARGLLAEFARLLKS